MTSSYHQRGWTSAMQTYTKFCLEMERCPSKIIALIFDWDKTLGRYYMQEETIFRENGLTGDDVWPITKKIADYYKDKGLKFDTEAIYLEAILTMYRQKRIKDLSRDHLVDLGKNITFFEGLPEFFPKFKRTIEDNPVYKKHNITVEYYVISNGIYDLIRGTPISLYLGNEKEQIQGIHANELDVFSLDYDSKNKESGNVIATPDNVFVRRGITSFSKSQALFDIEKGRFDKDDKLAIDQIRIPFSHMIYVADGKSDNPPWTVVKNRMGRGIAVYNPEDRKKDKDGRFGRSYYEAQELQRRDTVDDKAPADYKDNSELVDLLTFHTCEIADWMVDVDNKIRHVPVSPKIELH